MVPTTKCLHCKEARPIHRRGLCHGCYVKKPIRDQYPILSVHAKRGLGIGNHRRPMPPFPTDAPPGTEEKIRVLLQRNELGQKLYHPLDARVPVV